MSKTNQTEFVRNPAHTCGTCAFKGSWMHSDGNLIIDCMYGPEVVRKLADGMCAHQQNNQLDLRRWLRMQEENNATCMAGPPVKFDPKVHKDGIDHLCTFPGINPLVSRWQCQQQTWSGPMPHATPTHVAKLRPWPAETAQAATEEKKRQGNAVGVDERKPSNPHDDVYCGKPGHRKTKGTQADRRAE